MKIINETHCRFCGNILPQEKMSNGLLLCDDCIIPSRKSALNEYKNVEGSLVNKYLKELEEKHARQ